MRLHTGQADRAQRWHYNLDAAYPGVLNVVRCEYRTLRRAGIAPHEARHIILRLAIALCGRDFYLVALARRADAMAVQP